MEGKKKLRRRFNKKAVRDSRTTTERHDMINYTLKLIKEQICIDLHLCYYFKGVREHNNKKYFNVLLSQKLSESNDFEKLKEFERKYNIIKVEPNGVRRVAIYLTTDLTSFN